MQHVIALAQEHAQPRLLALFVGGVEVVVEVTDKGGIPRDSPVHARSVRLELRKGGARDKSEGGVVRPKTGQIERDVVDQIRAAGAAVRPARIEHEMVDDQLTAPLEEV